MALCNHISWTFVTVDGIGKEIEDKQSNMTPNIVKKVNGKSSPVSDAGSTIKENNNIVVEVVTSTPTHKVNGAPLSNHR